MTAPTLAVIQVTVLEHLADTWDQFAEYNDALAEAHEREGRDGSASKAYGVSVGYRDAAKQLRALMPATTGEKS